MPTLDKIQIERLERLLNQTHPCFSRQSQSAEKNTKRIKILILAAIAFALFAAVVPTSATLTVGSLIVVSLLVLNYSIQRSSPNGASLFGSIKNLSILAIALGGAAAFIAAVAPPNAGAVSGGLSGALSGGLFPVTNTFNNHHEYKLDPNLGRTVVGEKTAGLSLKKSLITGHVDANSLTSALYLSMIFNNKTFEPKEARARIALPPEAVVSRVTLWINGVEQEAAFNSAERVQASYQWIVNTGRDPILVTETKKGEVFLQAYPVPQQGEMKVRIGITTPLDAQSRKAFQLVPPHLVSSNFDEKGTITEVKLESNAIIDSNLTGQKVSEVGNDQYSLTGSIKADASQKCRFSIYRETDFDMYASRATHSLEKSYIVESLKKQGNAYRLVTDKTLKMPAIPVANDFPTASRMSTVWAAQEARKCLKQNDMHTAALLGCVYRIVTPATGAVVLENDWDYEYTGLKRNLYSVVSAKTRAPKHRLVKTRRSSSGHAYQKDERGIIDPHSAFNSGPVADNTYYNPGSQTGVPTLQGATNGTIGPQVPILQGSTSGPIGPMSADAAAVMGVNTAGTVRVNNLANLEHFLTTLSAVCQIAGIICGVYLLALGLFQSVSYHRAISRMLTGASCLMFGILTPTTVYWLIAAVRDANLLS